MGSQAPRRPPTPRARTLSHAAAGAAGGFWLGGHPSFPLLPPHREGARGRWFAQQEGGGRGRLPRGDRRRVASVVGATTLPASRRAGRTPLWQTPAAGGVDGDIRDHDRDGHDRPLPVRSATLSPPSPLSVPPLCAGGETVATSVRPGAGGGRSRRLGRSAPQAAAAAAAATTRRGHPRRGRRVRVWKTLGRCVHAGRVRLAGGCAGQYSRFFPRQELVPSDTAAQSCAVRDMAVPETQSHLVLTRHRC